MQKQLFNSNHTWHVYLYDDETASVNYALNKDFDDDVILQVYFNVAIAVQFKVVSTMPVISEVVRPKS